MVATSKSWKGWNRLESTHFLTQVFQIPSELLIFATTSSLLQKVAMFTSERARESPLHERWALHSFLVRIIRVLLVEELAARLAAATLIGLICKGNMWGPEVQTTGFWI